MSQLLAHVERLISHLQNNEIVDVIYLDFSKAFDKVDHCILLHKPNGPKPRGTVQCKGSDRFQSDPLHWTAPRGLGPLGVSPVPWGVQNKLN